LETVVSSSLATSYEPSLRATDSQINHDKTRLTRRTQRQRVTGLVVNEKAHVGQSYVRDLRNVLYIWSKYGQQDAEVRFAASHPSRSAAPGKQAPFASRIAGRIQYVGSIKGWADPSYRALARSLERLDPTFTPKTARELESPVTVILYTEGETDVLHFNAALRELHKQGHFNNLDFKIVPESACGNDAKLLEMAKALGRTRQSLPSICVFDRDDPKMLATAVGPTGSRDYRNGVGAVAIIPPTWRTDDDPVCIEMLYPDDDLMLRDDKGRRIYLLSEFDPLRVRLHAESEEQDACPGRCLRPRQQVPGACQASVRREC
jgi:RNA-directed DNA polymerase